MQTLAGDFQQESEALYALIASLDDGALEQKTAFKDWTISTVVRHLHVWNQAATMSLRDDGSFERYYRSFAEFTAGGAKMSAFENMWIDGLTGRALVDAWRLGVRDTAAGFAGADPQARVKWAGPEMSVRSSMTARLMETWAHGQEVYDLLGVVRVNTDRIRSIVVLGNNTYGWTFKVRGETPPEVRPHLRLTAPSGAVWLYNDPSETELIEGPADEFCQVVTQTRNIADTTLRVAGLNAANWMSKAQCFAGVAESPPPFGTRRTSHAAR